MRKSLEVSGIKVKKKKTHSQHIWKLEYTPAIIMFSACKYLENRHWSSWLDYKASKRDTIILDVCVFTAQHPDRYFGTTPYVQKSMGINPYYHSYMEHNWKNHQRLYRKSVLLWIIRRWFGHLIMTNKCIHEKDIHIEMCVTFLIVHTLAHNLFPVLTCHAHN